MHVALIPRSFSAKGPTASSCPAPQSQPRRVPISTSRQAFRGSCNVNGLAHRSIGRRARHSSALVTRCVQDVTETDFEEQVLKADKPVLVDFWATWCGPCKLIAPLLSTFEKELGDSLKIVKIEADPCPNLMETYKVYGLPTLILFKDGKVVEGSQQEGAIGKEKLRAYLEKHGVVMPVAK